jgi:hypothetical protein
MDSVTISASDAIHLATVLLFGAQLKRVVTYGRMGAAARVLGLVVAAPA